ncbi:hypothetical protein L3X38_038450 [Prunus dulcis]|uniref:CN hydrolase domain-containing protein n=1 Tax=Prunus dulcis TaxID=3755 RepID=A0AAD4YQH7_PRUDU|nr:hypothetical protein L3X38_038450 [Prunus dulcis]
MNTDYHHHIQYQRRPKWSSSSASPPLLAMNPTLDHCASILWLLIANSLRVAAAQMTSINDLAANFATCSRLVKEAAAAGAKLICFPESFSFIGAKDGDSLKIAQPLDGPILQQYCSLARESGIWLSLVGLQEKGSDD